MKTLLVPSVFPTLLYSFLHGELCFNKPSSVLKETIYSMIESIIIILSLKYLPGPRENKNNFINYKRDFTYSSGQKKKTILKDVHVDFLQTTPHISYFGIYVDIFTVYITHFYIIVLGNNYENGLKEKVNISFHSWTHWWLPRSVQYGWHNTSRLHLHHLDRILVWASVVKVCCGGPTKGKSEKNVLVFSPPLLKTDFENTLSTL